MKHLLQLLSHLFPCRQLSVWGMQTLASLQVPCLVLGAEARRFLKSLFPGAILQCCQWFLVGLGRPQAQCGSAKGCNGDGDRCVHLFWEALIIFGNCFKIHSVIVLVVMVLAAASLVSNSFNLKVHCHCLPPILASYL